MPLDDIDIFMEAIGKIESGGRYHEIGVPTKGGRALGKYQIMSSNWSNWARMAGIPGARWEDPRAQDHVARFMMSRYYAMFGSWDAVAVAWFAGEGTARRYVRGDKSVGNRKDALGTSVARYVDKTMMTMAQLRSGAGRGDIHQGTVEEIRRRQLEEEQKRLRELAAQPKPPGNHLVGEDTAISEQGMGAMQPVDDLGAPLGIGTMAARELTGEQAMGGILELMADLAAGGRRGDINQAGPLASLSQPTGMAAEAAAGRASEIVAPSPNVAAEREAAEEEAALARGREIKEGLDPELMAARGQAAGGVTGNVFTPKGNWERGQVNQWASQVAGRFGVRANDSYRSPQHNARVGGAKNSDHLWGGAVDFFGPKANMDKLAAWARAHSGPGKPFRIVLWQVKGHFDHVHISFHRNTNTPAPLPG